jgi:pyridoxamine 5'-phosphate oxidase
MSTCTSRPDTVALALLAAIGHLPLRIEADDDYGCPVLTGGDFTERDDPFALFADWLAEATQSEPNDPNALALATVDPDGLPNVRMVLLKGVDARGFVFYTNFESAKGREILASMKAAMCFHWKSLRRQVRVRGPVEVVEDAEADAYYASRPRGSRIGAWASKQSRPLESRFALEKAVAEYTAKHPIGEIPRPPHWSGFRILPQEMEFWHDRPFRLHDRAKFTRDGDGPWSRVRLYP